MESHLKRQIGWSDVEWLRSQWNKPIILKGIQSLEDALIAQTAGIDGIVLSNHGGRQLDGSPSPMQLLQKVSAAIGDQVIVMADSGFRRGGDIIKALALGAKAVWLGRATLYGVATSGEPGVQNILAILEDEMTRCMTLLGLSSIDQIDASAIRYPIAESPCKS
jgi:(S)-mandelate dehydrogenase